MDDKKVKTNSVMIIFVTVHSNPRYTMLDGDIDPMQI